MEIKKLTDYAHIRLRTEMYFGSRVKHTQMVPDYRNKTLELVEETWVPALYTSWREILDNALDEVVGHGFGNRIDVCYNPETMEFSVEDNGRGIPIDWDSDHNMHKATLALSEARAGRNFGDRAETAGVNGVGGAGVNFTSEFFQIEIFRDKKKFVQEFHEGNAAFDELVINKPLIKDTKNPNTGTKITWKPSKTVFVDRTLPLEFLAARIYEVAIANPLITVTFNGEKIRTKVQLEKNLFADEKTICFDINEEGFRSKWVIKNSFSGGEYTHTLVNNIPAFNGGAHMDQFRRQFISNLLSGLEKENRKRKLTPNRSDVGEGLLIYNITKMTAPNFDSQSKTRLINEEPIRHIKTFLDNVAFFKTLIKKNEEWIDEIYARCAERTHAQDAKDLAKESKKLAKKKVAKLMDATGDDRQKCILLLGEGDSAIGGLSQVRDPEVHGGLPLRGKIINVNGENARTVLENQAAMDIMNATGLTIGEVPSVDSVRYGHIYLGTDADEDGKNIAALLTNFLYTYWPSLFSENSPMKISVFMTPFIIAEKGKERKYWYVDDYSLFDPSAYKGWSITRAKGLGTLQEVHWDDSIKNPKLFTLIADGDFQETLDLIFNNGRADDRKEWMSI